MTRRLSLLLVLAAALVAGIFLIDVGSDEASEPMNVPASLLGGETDPADVQAIFETYRDPATNSIPADMRQRELAYVRTLPRRGAADQRRGGSGELFAWTEAGPSDIGGRTRVVVFDATDPATVLTGGVYGGIWKSTDAGQTWTLKTTVGEHPGVTALVQDPRPGQADTWYYGSGEWRGDTTPSDRGFRAIYNGVGIYKSEDNGETWALLPATADPNPTGCCDAFDYVHRLAINPSTGTLFAASNTDGIYRSTDGGASFTLVLGTAGQFEWTEVVAAPNGTLVASLSSSPNNAPQAGVYRSTNDGQTWEPITPASFPSTHRRSVIAVAPSNPDLAYIMTFVAPNRGDGREDIRLHTLDLANGGGEDRTANMPNFPGGIPAFGPSIHSFVNFTMSIAVKPDDEDFVVIGGVTVFRSRDGFTTPLTDQAGAVIGGRRSFSTGAIFPNHWVDNHTFVFHPENPDEMWCGNDNGVSVMRDATAPPVWEEVDRGYNVAQYYGIDIADAAGDERIAGGLQDYGMISFADRRDAEEGAGFSGSARFTTGDGGYVYLGANRVYATVNSSILVRSTYLNDSLVATANTAVPQPAGATGHRFINPFAIDPNDEQILYYPAGQVLWRNENIEASNPGSFWTQAATMPAGYSIGAVTASRQPAHVVYVGANNFSLIPRAYRWEGANAGPATLQEISIPGAPSGAYIHDIAVHPEDADEILVVLSNYNIIGLYHSTDGGDSYTAVEGNLHGGGLGPSLRTSTILEADDGTSIYLVGTSAGLFSTIALNGMNTVWEQEAFERLGNIVVEHITSRPSDGRVAVGTHGRGAFVGDPLFAIDAEPTTTPEGFALAQNFPNPFRSTTQIAFTLDAPGQVTLAVYDVQGRRVAQVLDGAERSAGRHAVPFDASGLASGTYLYRLDVMAAGGPTRQASARMTILR